jgi:hypothetical protein
VTVLAGDTTAKKSSKVIDTTAALALVRDAQKAAAAGTGLALVAALADQGANGRTGGVCCKSTGSPALQLAAAATSVPDA